jgi:hypothetical protein
MAALSLATGRTVSLSNAMEAIVQSYKATAATAANRVLKVDAGIVVHETSDTIALGLGLNSAAVAAGDVIDVVLFGTVTGYDLSALAVGAAIYANAGAVHGASGDVIIGVVVPSQVESSGKAILINCLHLIA